MRSPLGCTRSSRRTEFMLQIPPRPVKSHLTAAVSTAPPGGARRYRGDAAELRRRDGSLGAPKGLFKVTAGPAAVRHPQLCQRLPLPYNARDSGSSRPPPGTAARRPGGAIPSVDGYAVGAARGGSAFPAAAAQRPEVRHPAWGSARERGASAALGAGDRDGAGTLPWAGRQRPSRLLADVQSCGERETRYVSGEDGERSFVRRCKTKTKPKKIKIEVSEALSYQP